MDVRYVKKTALLLCVIILLSCFSGCDLEKSITDRFVFVDQSAALCIPHVNTFKGEDEANRRIQNFYAPVITLLEDDEHDFSLRHYVSRDGSRASVRTYVCENENEWYIGEFEIHMNGTLYFSELGNIAWMDNGDFLSDVLALSQYGYIANPDKHRTAVSCGQVYSEMIRFYELYCAHELDIERISLSASGTDDYLKAFELFMDAPNDALYYDSSLIADDYFFCTAAVTLLSELMFDPCGMSSSDAKISDMLEMCSLLMSFYSADGWQELCDEFSRLAQEHERANNLAVRDSVAEVFVDLYNSCVGPAQGLYAEPVPLNDTENPFAVTAVSAGFMQEFPNHGLFAGEYVYHFGELPEAASLYINIFSPESSSLEYHEFISRLSAVAQYADRCGRADEPLVTVMNTRDYSFYIRQHDGTQYAHVNCMPTITAMAVKWYANRDLTPSQVRALFLPEKTGGWYMKQVEEALDEYDVPYTEYWLKVDDMIMTLDSGRIILTQMSETDLDRSGHCLVIWGYKRCGNAVRFYCHDPGMEGGTNKYGGFRGDGIVRDRAYIYYIINRFASGFVAVGDFDPEGLTDFSLAVG